MLALAEAPWLEGLRLLSVVGGLDLTAAGVLALAASRGAARLRWRTLSAGRLDDCGAVRIDEDAGWRQLDLSAQRVGVGGQRARVFAARLPSLRRLVMSATWVPPASLDEGCDDDYALDSRGGRTRLVG